MKDNTLSSKDIMIAIPYLPKVARGLLNKGKKYDELLLEILKYDAFSEDNQHFPSNKELQAKLKLSAGQLRTQLASMYQDFLDSMSTKEGSLSFGNILVDFYVQGYYNSTTFFAKINQIPLVGDTIELPFLRPLFKGNSFYIKRVIHKLMNDSQQIVIWVKQGVFNWFEFMELEQAISEDRYDWKTDSITSPAPKTVNHSFNRNTRYW